MAYLDNHNQNLYTQGDPLENLDRELAELKASIEKLDSGMLTQTAAEHPAQSDSPVST